MKKILALAFVCLVLSSCSKAIIVGEELAPKATEQQQEEVKQEVLKLLEEEYNQPFKMVDYKYDYGVHWQDNTCQLAVCPKEYYGIYWFTVKAIENPEIVVKFRVFGTQEGLADFQNRVKFLYCDGFADYWKKNSFKTNDSVLNKNKKYCDDRGQTSRYSD
jgi:hypothetical protein